MGLRLIVDGYNLLLQIPELRQPESPDLEEGRKGLLEKLRRYQRLRKHTLILVFDGGTEGHFSERQTRSGSIQVIFSRQGEKADDLIKRLVSQGADETIVVTSDRELGAYCLRAGGTVISSQEFSQKMAFAEYLALKGKSEPEDLERISEPRGTKKKGPSKRLSKSERRHLNRRDKL